MNGSNPVTVTVSFTCPICQKEVTLNGRRFAASRNYMVSCPHCSGTLHNVEGFICDFYAKDTANEFTTWPLTGEGIITT